MADNKILYGLKNCYYAKKTGSTYGTPVALPGAVSIDLTASGDSSTFYADDIAYAVFNANMTEQTFMQEGWHHEIQKGLDQAKAEKLYTAEEVEEMLKKEFHH